MAQFLVLRYEPTTSPPWQPVAIVDATLEEGGEYAITQYLTPPLSAEQAGVERWKAVRFDDGPEMVPTVSLASADEVTVEEDGGGGSGHHGSG